MFMHFTKTCLFALLLIGCLVPTNVQCFGTGFDDEEVLPIDPQFSDNACIIIESYTVPDCTLAPPDRFIEEILPDPCPGCSKNDEIESVQMLLQVQYENLEDAIEDCPYDPILIEFTGTLYISSDEYLWYNRTKDVIIRGLNQVVTVGGEELITLEPMNVTMFNSTTNTTTITEELIEVITVTPVVNETFAATIVGLKDWQFLYDNVSVTFDNVVLDGCQTERGVFLTQVKPERCEFPDPPIECCGAYFPSDAANNILNQGACQRTASNFDLNRYYTETVYSDAWRLQTEVTAEAWIRPLGDMKRFAGIIAKYVEDDDEEESGWGIAWGDPIIDEETGKETEGIWWLTGHEGDFERIKAPAPMDQWTHIAGVFDNGVSRVYVNGELYDEVTIFKNDIDYNRERPLYVGRGAEFSDEDDDNYDYFNGLIDEVRIWKVARTGPQIQATYRNTVDPLNPDLLGYMRFDLPRGSEPDEYQRNLVTSRQGRTDLDLEYIVVNGGGPSLNTGPPDALPVCFCREEDGLCVATDLFEENPPDAIQQDFGQLCSAEDESCRFVHGKVIDPNGDFGKLWLPGLKEISGPIFNETERFVPGQFFEQVITTDISVYNATTNTTTVITVPDPNAISEPVFVPGVVPSQLPPLGAFGDNPWWFIEEFVPGWFANDGMPPYWALNFYPGIFVNASDALSMYGVPLPDLWEEGDLVFVPGLQLNSTGFVPYTILDPLYIEPVILFGGFTFNFQNDTEACSIPGAPEQEEVDVLVPMEDEFGCQVGPDDPEPLVLDPSQRDPCFVLRDIREQLPEGTESLAAEEILGCNAGPDDPEPFYLDPSQRDPCFVLRDLREQLNTNFTSFAENCTRSGGVPMPPIFISCLTNQNVTIVDSIIRNYYGDRVVCQWACEENVNLDVSYSNFQNTPGSAIWSSGLQNYDINNNKFCPCGGKTEACVYLNANHITRGEFALWNNRHCAVEDLLPINCDYDITPSLRCVNGVLQCLNVTQTLLDNCQRVEISDGVTFFDSDCAVYDACQCESRMVNVTLSNGQIVEQEIFDGDLQIEIPFLTPDIEELVDGNNTLTLSCQLSNQTFEFNYICQEIVEVNITLPAPLNNITMLVNITIDANCTDIITIPSGMVDSLPCPCPEGFNANFTSNSTGSQAGIDAGLYQECEWSIPDGLPGEVCLDTVVQCPFEGGTLGSGLPPPIPIGLCNDGSALVECNTNTCINGTLIYEDTEYACDLNSGTCLTDNLLEIPCMCDNGAIIVPCERNITCIPQTSCDPVDSLCLVVDGILTWNNEEFPCAILTNETLCVGATYVPEEPAPSDGFLALPCDNSYETPGPGPCSCLGDVTLTGDNSTSIPALAPICNMTIDPNCTEPIAQPIDTGMESLQLTCNTDGTLSCRCDGFQAIDVILGGNATLLNTSAAFYIDHVPPDASLWFQRSNVAQGLPFGWRYERFGLRLDSGWDLLKWFALKVLHFRTGESIMHESARVSPLVTGTIQDWVQGHPQQWNRRVCTDGCYQGRPRLLSEACVVNQDFGLQSPDWFTLRYNRIQDAHDFCPFNAVIIQKGENVFEETIDLRRDNFWLGSYDNAVIVGSNHGIRGNNITIRGCVWVHPTTNPYPIFSPTGISEFFDTADDDDTGESPPRNFTLLNNEIIGDGAIDVGAIVGPLGSFFKMAYNTVRNFFTRAVDIEAEDVTVELNRFILNTGRCFRGRNMLSFRFDENKFIECTGITEGENVDMVSMEAFGDLGVVTANNIASLAFQEIFGDTNSNSEQDADVLFDVPELDPDRGCNTDYDSSRVCLFRGNIQTVSLDQPDQSFVVYRFIGGNMQKENFIDNTANHGRYGALFTHTSGITYLERSEVFKTNALIRTELTREVQDNSADFGYIAPGSLVVLACSFPDCLSLEEQYPIIESNPRFDLIRIPEYGFRYIHNVTDCNIFSLTLNQCSVTSERARLRREDITFSMDFWAIGANDLNCCDKPVIYGTHVILADRTILEYIEFRYEYNVLAFEDAPFLFKTIDEFNAFQIIMNEVCLDGRYFIGNEDRVRVIDFFMRVEDGEFVLQNSLIYNWWHYPNNTQLGFIDDPRGAVEVVILPDGTVFITERSPNVDGIYVSFTKPRRIDLSPFVVNMDEDQEFVTVNEFGQQIDLTPEEISTLNGRVAKPVAPPTGDEVVSFASVVNNVFMDFDGRVISIHQPANWYIANNQCLDCGMRQYEEIAVIDLEGNTDSKGDYIVENNYIIQSKPFLFPIGGGIGNKVRVSCYQTHEFGRPRIWQWINNTCVLLENQEDTGVFSTSAELAVVDGEVSADEPILSLSGFFSSEGVNPLDLNDNTVDDVPEFDGTADDTLGTPLRVNDIIGANGNQRTAESSQELEGDDENNGINQYSVNPNQRGHTVGARFFDIDRDTMVKTLLPGVVNTTLFPFDRPSLYPLRAIASALNSQNTVQLLADGMITPDQIPTNGPGIQGLNADIIYCNTYGDVLQGVFAECAICNDGCPVLPPDRCIVDPQNDTFVPENPYFGRWLFASINDAALNCVNPTRIVEIRKQDMPYVQALDLKGGNLTFFGSDQDDPPVIDVSVHPITLNANNITFQNIIFNHKLGNLVPTVKSSNILLNDIMEITFDNCTFNGGGTTNSAVSGRYDSIAFESCIFTGYDGARILNIISDCGSLIVENSEFYNAKGSAIYAQEFDFILIRRNVFDNCGGMFENELACVYVRSCNETVVEIIFAGNEHQVDPDDVIYEKTGDFMPQGYVSAYWIDGIPFTSQNVTVDLSGNYASGLPVGLRATRIDIITSNLLITDDRATVQWLYIINRNIGVDGRWHDVVIGEPIDDQFIDDNPIGSVKYYWDRGSTGSTQSSVQIIVISIMLSFAFIYTYVSCRWRIAKAPDGYTYSQALNDYIPMRWSRW